VVLVEQDVVRANSPTAPFRNDASSSRRSAPPRERNGRGRSFAERVSRPARVTRLGVGDRQVSPAPS